MGNTNSNMPFSIENLPYACLKGHFKQLENDECDAVTKMNLEWNEIAIQMNSFWFCAMYAKNDDDIQFIRPCMAHRSCGSKDCTMMYGYHSCEYETLFNLKCHCTGLSSETTINVTGSLRFVE